MHKLENIYLLIFLIFLISMCSLLCLITVTMESFKKKGGDYLLTIKLENCCHNSFPNISIKINCNYKYAFTCICNKITGFET